MAEKKPWAHLDDAINDLWSSFFGASDRSLTLFCRNYSDQRIPESFLEKFIIKLEGWNPTEDPEYKIPKALMSEVFKATKKKMRKKFNKKKLAEVAAEEEKIAVEEEKVAAEEETVKEEEITQEEINKNLKALSIRTENARKVKMIQRAERAEKNKATTEQTKMAAQSLNVKNQLRGIDKETKNGIDLLVTKTWWN